MPKPWENKSGCKDPTAYEALKPMEEEAQRVNDFVKAIRILAGLCGFEIISWVKIRAKKTGRIY